MSFHMEFRAESPRAAHVFLARHQAVSHSPLPHHVWGVLSDALTRLQEADKNGPVLVKASGHLMDDQPNSYERSSLDLLVEPLTNLSFITEQSVGL